MYLGAQIEKIIKVQLKKNHKFLLQYKTISSAAKSFISINITELMYCKN